MKQNPAVPDIYEWNRQHMMVHSPQIHNHGKILQWERFQVMACHIPGAKPLSEPNTRLLLRWPLQTNVKFEIKQCSNNKMNLKISPATILFRPQCVFIFGGLYLVRFLLPICICIWNWENNVLIFVFDAMHLILALTCHLCLPYIYKHLAHVFLFSKIHIWHTVEPLRPLYRPSKRGGLS